MRYSVFGSFKYMHLSDIKSLIWIWLCSKQNKGLQTYLHPNPEHFEYISLDNKENWSGSRNKISSHLP